MTLKDVSKQSFTDDFLVVVVSLDCESDENIVRNAILLLNLL